MTTTKRRRKRSAAGSAETLTKIDAIAVFFVVISPALV